MPITGVKNDHHRYSTATTGSPLTSTEAMTKSGRDTFNMDAVMDITTTIALLLPKTRLMSACLR
jgi:hypothetical protein